MVETTVGIEVATSPSSSPTPVPATASIAIHGTIAESVDQH